MQIMAEAKNLLPGGVNSPVRAFKSVGGGPIVFDHVKGAYAYDVDGNKYIDYVLSWGPAICGHANDTARSRVEARLRGCSPSSLCASCGHDVSVRTFPSPLNRRLRGQVNAALAKQMEKGTSFGAPCALEVRSSHSPRCCLIQRSCQPRACTGRSTTSQ